MKAVTHILNDTAVVTEIDGYSIATEPPVANGGTGEFPPATRMVVAALLNCTFSSVKAFCKERKIDMKDVSMEFTGEFADGVYTSMRMNLVLSPDFPEKYESSLGRIFDACAVKKIIKNLPAIDVAYEKR